MPTTFPNLILVALRLGHFDFALLTSSLHFMMIAEPPTTPRPGPSPSQTLFTLLSNPLILNSIFPHLRPYSVLNIAFTNRSFRDLVLNSPYAFRHLDLTLVKKAHFDIDGIDHGGHSWRNVQLDENLTEDDFYSGPLRSILNTLQRRSILEHVHTLVLDGLSVTSDLAYDIINDSRFNVRILSLRDVRNLNEGKLQGALQYACRKTRPPGTPKLQALYVFGQRDLPSTGAHNGPEVAVAALASYLNGKSQKVLAQTLQDDPWWSDTRKGETLRQKISTDWAYCMMACEGVISFDAALCQGPRHRNSPLFGQSQRPPGMSDKPAVATHALSGCSTCRGAPEGITSLETPSSHALPLLAPPPMLSSTLTAAITPQAADASFVPRCKDCLWERWCRRCNVWWCESCYTLPSQFPDHAKASQGPADNFHIVDDIDITMPLPNSLETLFPDGEADLTSDVTPKTLKPRVTKSCWECGNNCPSCIAATQRSCQKCHSGYCTVHNEGSTTTHCDWCVTRGRGLGRLGVSSGPAMPSLQVRRPVVRDDGRLIHVSG